MSELVTPRILVIAGTVPPPFIGGAERTMIQIYEGLEANGAGIVVGFLGIKHDEVTDAPLHPFAEVTNDVRLWNFYPPSSRKQHKAVVRKIWQIVALISPVSVWLAYREVRRKSPDVIVCHNLWGWGIAPWLVARLTKKPLVQVIHDYQYACFRGTLWTETSGPCQSVCKSCIPRMAVSKVTWPSRGVSVFVSRYLRDTLVQLGIFDNARSHVAHPPKPTYLSLTGVEPTFRFGYIGRLEVEKGIEHFLFATKQLGMSALVAGLGEPDYVSSLELSHVEYAGQMSTQQFMDAVDIVVIPSLWPEPFGRVALEAAAAGRYAVVAEVGGLPESFALGKGRGLIYADLTPEGLVSAMQRSLVESKSTDDLDVVDSCTSFEPWMTLRRAIDQAIGNRLA